MLQRERVDVVVDEVTIARGDPREIIHPVHWLIDIYNGPEMYQHSCQRFSKAQCLVHAILLYATEVKNGGHRQFFSNSSGVVWKNAYEGFEAIGIPRAVQALKIAAERLGGNPSLDRDERQDQQEANQPEFDDIDQTIWNLLNEIDLQETLSQFIQQRPAEFYFSGTIERLVLAPKLTP